VDLYALPDQRVVTIRPIRADDRERLRASHDRLSPETRYRRFMSAKPHLSAADAHYLVAIDGRDHYALVATVAEPDGEEIVAVARFVRLPGDPGAAEFAIVVGDDWQHQGLGAKLMRCLAQAAVQRGVERFVATVLADNEPIRRLAERVAVGPVRRRRHDSTLELELDLVADRHAPAIIAACGGS
jgi:RimJ/RimL family protein N-acetyltransferase